MSDKTTPLWQKENAAQRHGLIGEVHQKYEKSLQSLNDHLIEKQSPDEYLPNYTPGQARLVKATASYEKLSALYAVLGSIQAQNTVVTADMIAPSTYTTCKERYGISKKELQRLVSDAQKGLVPELSLRRGDQQTSPVASSIKTVSGISAERAEALKQRVQSKRDEIIQQINSDPDMTVEEKADSINQINAMSDREFAKNYRMPDSAYIRENWDFARHNRVTVEMHSSVSGIARMNPINETATLSHKILSGNELQKKQGLFHLRSLLEQKRSDAKLKSFQAVSLTKQEQEQFKKSYGFSKKDTEKLSLEIQAGKIKTTMSQSTDMAILSYMDTARKAVELADQTPTLSDPEQQKINEIHAEKVKTLYTGQSAKKLRSSITNGEALKPGSLSGQILAAQPLGPAARRIRNEQRLRERKNLNGRFGSLRIRDISWLTASVFDDESSVSAQSFRQEETLAAHSMRLIQNETCRADIRDMSELLSHLHSIALNELSLGPDQQLGQQDPITLNSAMKYADLLKNLYESGPGKLKEDAVQVVTEAFRHLTVLMDELEAFDAIDSSKFLLSSDKTAKRAKRSEGGPPQVRLKDIELWLTQTDDYVQMMRDELTLLEQCRADLFAYQNAHPELFREDLPLIERMKNHPLLNRMAEKAHALCGQRMLPFKKSIYFGRLTPQEQEQFDQHHQYFQSIIDAAKANARIIDQSNPYT